MVNVRIFRREVTIYKDKNYNCKKSGRTKFIVDSDTPLNVLDVIGHKAVLEKYLFKGNFRYYLNTSMSDEDFKLFIEKCKNSNLTDIRRGKINMYITQDINVYVTDKVNNTRSVQKINMDTVTRDEKLLWGILTVYRRNFRYDRDNNSVLHLLGLI